jgi:hypothetical protein
MRQKILLLGNGINNNTSGFKWADLIRDLTRFVPKGIEIATNNKPFPLLYEEIVIRAMERRSKQEQEIKQFITSRVSAIQPNEIHGEIARNSFRTILTTNYDYNIEKAFEVDIETLKNLGIIKETRYSVFRHSRLGGTDIWHIHGESRIPSSIALGYDHYSGYLQHLRNYVVTGTGDSYESRHLKPLIGRIRAGQVLGDSWIDFFFDSDVYVLGLTLDFAEIHLWWLLTYRARCKYTKRIPIHNKIVYFVPRQYIPPGKEKIDLLKTCDVQVYPLDYDKAKRTEYYRKALRIIRNS